MDDNRPVLAVEHADFDKIPVPVRTQKQRHVVIGRVICDGEKLRGSSSAIPRLRALRQIGASHNSMLSE